MRRTLALVDLSTIRKNIQRIKKFIPQNTKYMIPVKANAYGHGLIEVSRYIESTASADWLAVACIEEAIQIREAGIKLPILNFGIFLPDSDDLEPICNTQISQTLVNRECALALSKTASRYKRNIPVHINIDTGMGRIGCAPEQAPALAQYISELPGLFLEGIYTHFPDSETPDSDFVHQQMNYFNKAAEAIESLGIKITLKHACNSGGVVNYPEYSFDMVRPGILTYGYKQASCFKPIREIEPAMTLSSCVIFTKKVPKGTPVSYGMTYTAERETTIVTIPIGYGDGLNRLLSNRGSVIINDQEFPISGRITMDQSMIDVGEANVLPGDEVIIFGKGPITASTHADICGTIPYEITCNIGARIPRRYIDL